MALKTFTTGEVLTAADTNTYLANAGLVYVASGSFTNAASFDVTGFSSTYDFYQLHVRMKAVGAASTVTAQLYSGATARNAGYYGGNVYANYLNTISGYANRNNAANFGQMEASTSQTSYLFATITGIDTGEFAYTLQYWDPNNVFALHGAASNFSTSSFDKIRYSGTNNLTGLWNLMGVRQG